MTPPNIAHGRLSLGSFVKLSVIASVGCLPVLVIVFGLAFFVGLTRGHHPTTPDEAVGLALWPLFLLLKGITSVFSVVLSGFFAGLCGYPFYAWLCGRRGGVILKGKFEVL
jgi:hypothetical protein